MKNSELKTINPLRYLSQVTALLLQLNPNKESKYIEQSIIQMHAINNYRCFGLYQEGILIGISSAWTSIRIYCGKQLELDNLVIDQKLQSKGFGKVFLNTLAEWAVQNKYESITLNTYVTNTRSHKFYFNEGFGILGVNFQKLIQ